MRVGRRKIPKNCRQKGEKMAEIKLFDTWTFQEEVPEPFHQLLKKEGLRKTTTTLEWLSQYIEKQEGTIESLFFDWRIYGRTKKAGGKFL